MDKIKRYEQMADFDMDDHEVINVMHCQNNGDWCKSSDVSSLEEKIEEAVERAEEQESAWAEKNDEIIALGGRLEEAVAMPEACQEEFRKHG